MTKGKEEGSSQNRGRRLEPANLQGAAPAGVSDCQRMGA